MAKCLWLIGLLASGAVLAQDAPVYRASGKITQNGRTLEIQSAVAIWDEGEKAITIGLFPFPVETRDVRTMVTGSAQELAASKPSPNPALWEKTPVAGIQIRYKKLPKRFTTEKLEGFSLRASGFEDSETSLGVSRRSKVQFAKEIGLLEGQMEKTGGNLRMASKGSESFSAGYLDWDLEIECRVHIKNEEPVATR